MVIMKILVVSDSHLNLEKLINAYEKEQPDVVICAGDHSKDVEELSYIYPKSEYYIVNGNCDCYDRKYKNEMCFQLKGVKFFLTHGNEYFVKSQLELIRERARQLKCDVVVFGHTHLSHISKENRVTLFNPGALKDGNYGIIEIEDVENINFFHIALGRINERETRKIKRKS